MQPEKTKIHSRLPDLEALVNRLRVQNTRSTLCWKVGNISGSTELFAL